MRLRGFGLIVLLCLGSSGCDSDRSSSVDSAPDRPDAGVDAGDAAILPDIAPPDRDGPTWPDDAVLIAVRIQSDRVLLNWSAATDESGIKHYELHLDEVVVATKAPHQLGGEVLGLSPSTEYVFHLIAFDTAGNASESGPSLTVTTPDEARPQWPDESALTASDITETTLTLRWNRAQDDIGIAHYRVYQDNIEVAVKAGNESRHAIDGLSPDTVYVFRIEAEDAEGNQSADGPSLMVQPSDLSPPAWPDDGALVAGDVTPTGLTLGWGAATDNIAVSQYVIHQGDVSIAQTEAAVTWLTVEGLSPWTEYTFSVEAVDGAENRSETPLSVTVSTPDHAPPTWAEGTALLVTDPQIDQVTLNWPEAQDDVAIAGYRVYRDLVLISETVADLRHLTVQNLNQEGTYGFSVQAMDPAGNESRGGPQLQVQLSDDQAPAWADDTALAVDARTDTTLSLSWPAATDNVAVTTYALSMDGELVRSVDGETTAMTLVGLEPSTEYAFVLVAGDAAGNATDPGLAATVSTAADQTAPTWPADAMPSADEVGETHVVLSWTAAEDAVGVATYVVSDGDGERARTEALSTRLEGLSPETEYTFTVQAVDAEGNASVDDPAVTVTTLAPPPMAPTTAEVYAGLRPSCGPCHHPGAPAHTAYFVSEMTFQELVAADPAVVIPGDPDNSLLIQLLDGMGPGDFQQMPLQGDPFSVLSAAGETEITTEAIRWWITTLAEDGP